MKIVVGLGNPGRKYEQTRHNIGYMVVADLARRCGQPRPRTAFQGEAADGSLGQVRTLLLCPQTFMNHSGTCVVQARDFYKLNNADVLVVCDDLNLPLGKLRFRARGTAGGQKGLEDIIRRLGGDDVPRLRVGIGAPPDRMDPADFVLSKFTKSEWPEAEAAVWRAADGAADWAQKGIEYCMNAYNS